MHPPSVPQAVQSCHELLLWIIPQLDKFPRARRFTLGERIEAGVEQPYENIRRTSFDKLRTNVYISEIIMFPRSC